MILFPNALAETAELEAALDTALEGLTTQEAAAGGTIVGIAIGLFIAVAIVWYIFQAIADWKIFAKARRTRLEVPDPDLQHHRGV
ncbi:MAG: hypothetical protein IJ646_02000 [Clostridia bacterium]|nr:hypothetical protein [Clostridia bacterium]MBR1558993.1 hypothetical protein [Clostridia bacterium]